MRADICQFYDYYAALGWAVRMVDHRNGMYQWLQKTGHLARAGTGLLAVAAAGELHYTVHRQ